MASRVGLTARTILVGSGSVDSAYTKLSRIMKKTGIDAQVKNKRYHEKPTQKRVRLEYERCARVYNREMRGRVKFVMAQSNPLPATAILHLK